jgi:TonB-dependent Receptor Plug Domain
VKRLTALFLFCALPLLSQSNSGELRLKVTDPSGRGVKTAVHIQSEANQYRITLQTGEQGNLDVQRLPYGVYQLQIEQSGFAPISEPVVIRSSLPTEYLIQLKLATVNQLVTVDATSTLIDPDQAGSVMQIGSDQIQHRLSSLPGRSLQDLINSQPGWLYEGNAVLHPRGSEYQTQFVVDGIPLTDNRSPSFGPEIGADDVESMSIYTAGIPAEYGRKMGGVVELNTLRDSDPGFHGQAVLSGGSFDTAGAFAQGQYLWGKNTFGGSAGGSMTDHYLNPVVPENYSNTGTLGDFSAHYQRELTQNDRINLSVRHDLSRYDLPNEFVQQQAGQRQTADNIETMGIVSDEHIFSSHTLADLRGMVRDNANDFSSNQLSTPIEVFQNNRFREGYFKGTVTANRGRQEWKFGVESDNTFLHENFSYIITDPTQFDPDTPLTFGFTGSRPDLEQSVFVQDLIRLGNWTVSAGLRWDHYQLCSTSKLWNHVSPFPAISRHRTSSCISRMTGFSRLHLSRTFCFPVQPQLNPLTRRTFSACRCNHRKETTTKVA